MLPRPDPLRAGRALVDTALSVVKELGVSKVLLSIPRPRFQLGPSAFASSPQKLGLIPPICRGHQTQPLHLLHCHSEEPRFVGRRRISALHGTDTAEILRFAQDDMPAILSARARSTAPLTPCGAWEPTFCFERRGLKQAGGLNCSGGVSPPERTHLPQAPIQKPFAYRPPGAYRRNDAEVTLHPRLRLGNQK